MTDSLLFEIKEGDTRPALRLRCLDGSTPVDLTLATTVRLLIKARDGTLLVNAAMTKEDQTQAATKGYVNRAWQAADTAVAGNYSLEVQVEWVDGGVQTFPASRAATFIVYKDIGP